jgi:chromosome segregation ATPase
VRLFLTSPPANSSTGQNDFIQIKSSYFNQKVPISFYLHSRGEGTRSRSVSPAVRGRTQVHQSPTRNSREASSARETIDELRGQLQLKDNKIKVMEETIGELQAKYPSLQQVIKVPNTTQSTPCVPTLKLPYVQVSFFPLFLSRQNRVEQERCTFEEKSAKILQILKRKDETISILQDQLERNTEKLEQNRERSDITLRNELAADGKAADYFTGRSLDAMRKLEGELAASREECLEMRDLLESSESANTKLQAQLDEAEAALKRRKSHGVDKELAALRDQRAEQSEQINVLVAEISRLRSDTSSSTQDALDDAKRQVDHLTKDLRKAEDRADECKRRYEEVEGLLAIGSAARKNESHERTAGDSVSDQLVGELTQSVREKNTAIGIFQARVERAEDRAQELEIQLSHAVQRAEAAQARYHELESRVQHSDRDGLRLAEKIDRIRLEKDEVSHKLSASEARLSHALEKVSEKESKDDYADAQVWWAYVWHEMRRRSSEDTGTGRAASEAESVNGGGTDGEEDMHAAAERMRRQLRVQAIELSTLRQDVLGKKLSSRKEVEALKEELFNANRELARLQAFSRSHREDREVKIAGLQTTIRTLSARSDMHAELTAARQELESEKLAGHHLRVDLDSYRDMLAAEKEKCLSCRKEVASLQGSLDAQAVLKSVLDVPGVDPAVLIEVYSGRMSDMQRDLQQVLSTKLHILSPGLSPCLVLVDDTIS